MAKIRQINVNGITYDVSQDVDLIYSPTSSNPQSGQAVAGAISTKADKSQLGTQVIYDIVDGTLKITTK